MDDEIRGEGFEIWAVEPNVTVFFTPETGTQPPSHGI